MALKKIFDAFQNATDAQRTFREISFLQQMDDHETLTLTLTLILTLTLTLTLTLNPEQDGHENIVQLYNVLKVRVRVRLRLRVSSR